MHNPPSRLKTSSKLKTNSGIGFRSAAVSPVGSSPVHLKSNSSSLFHSPSPEYKEMKLTAVSQLLVNLKKESHKNLKEIKRMKKENNSKSK